MGGRPTDAEVLAKLDAADNPVTRSSLKDVCVSRLRDAVEREASKDAKIERLRKELNDKIPDDCVLVPAQEWQEEVGENAWLRNTLQKIKEDYEHDRACGLEQDRTKAYYETACQALANQTTESDRG